MRDDRDRSAIARSTPADTAYLDAAAQVPIDFAEGERLIATVVPTSAQEGAGLSRIGERLLDVHAPTILGAARTIGSDDIGSGVCRARARERPGVTAHPRVILVSGRS